MPQSRREAGGVRRSAQSKAGAGLDELLGPDRQVGGLLLEGGVSLAEDSLEGPGVGPVGGPQSAGGAVQEETSLAHRSADDAKAVGRIDHDLEATTVLPGHHVAPVDPKLAATGLELHLEAGESLVLADVGAGAEGIVPRGG